MISVLIPTQNSERFLVPTLSALVPGSAEGLLREVILADGGSTDGTARIADAAGCELWVLPGGSHARLRAAAGRARGPWLLLLDPAAVLEEGWTREVAKFVESAERTGQADRHAAAFRYAIDGYGFAPRFREAVAALRMALTGSPRAEQGLLATKRFYQSRGGKVGRAVGLRTCAVVLSE
jgi:glycosyltransferase involved in cell wall biosynthesis